MRHASFAICYSSILLYSVYVEAQSQRQRETQWNVRIARTRHATTLQRHAAIRVITNWQNRDWYQIEKI